MVSTYMGDRLGIPRALSILFLKFNFNKKFKFEGKIGVDLFSVGRPHPGQYPDWPKIFKYFENFKSKLNLKARIEISVSNMVRKQF